MNNDIKILRNSILEYINSLIGIYSNFFSENDNIDKSLVDSYQILFNLQESISKCEDFNTLKDLKEKITSLDIIIKNGIYEEKKKKLSSRERDLISRGYSEEDVINLCYCSEKKAKDISNIIFERISAGCKSSENPICIYLGGQPGCGKTTKSMDIKRNFGKDGIVEIGIDNYRTYHPNYLEMEEVIKKHWENRFPDSNNSPGNDIADFTHSFAGNMTNMLQEKATNENYNIAMEWAMRESSEPLKVMRELKSNNYQNIVDYIVVPKEVSLNACILRADVMNSNNHIVRRIPESFHNYVCSALPKASKEIYDIGVEEEHIIDSFKLTSRDDKTIWEKGMTSNLEEVYYDWLNKPEYSSGYRNHEEFAKIAYENESHGFRK